MVKLPNLSSNLDAGVPVRDHYIKGVLFKRTLNGKRYTKRWFSLNFQDFQLRYYEIGKYWKVKGPHTKTNRFFFFFFSLFSLFLLEGLKDVGQASSTFG